MTDRWTNQCIDGHVTHFTSLVGPPHPDEEIACKCGSPFENPWQPLVGLPKMKSVWEPEDPEERIYLEDRVDELEDTTQELQSQIDMLKERVDALERNQNRNSERPPQGYTPDPGANRGSEVGGVGGVDDGLPV